MPFDASFMKYPVVYPDPDLLARHTASATMQTPAKVKEVMGEYVLPAPPAARPFTTGSMVLSFDGKMGFADNVEGHLVAKENRYDAAGAAADFWQMLVCRTYADGVILGTNTLRARLHRLWFAEIADEDLVAARPGLGKQTPQPLNIIATLDGRDMPLESQILDITPRPLFITSHAGAAYLHQNLKQPSEIVTDAFDPYTDGGNIRIVAAGDGPPDTAAIMGILRRSGLDYLSVEAPSYIWHLVGQEMLDEFMMSYSGVYAGGTLALGGQAPYTTIHHPHVALLSVGVHKSFLHTRQKVLYGQ